MIDNLFAKVFGTKHEREVKKMLPEVVVINDLEPGIQALSDADLAAKTAEFKQRLANGESLDELMFEAFAVCREVGRRVLGAKNLREEVIDQGGERGKGIPDSSLHNGTV